MHLSRLLIENYRSVKKIDLKFEPGKNVIVGRNNSGKSNLLKAIDLVLGEYSPTYSKTANVTDNDFYCGETENPIFIWCEINRGADKAGTLEAIDFTDVEKTAFFRVYNDRNCTNEIRIAVSDFNEFEKAKIFEFCSEEGQARIDNNQFGKKWLGGKSYCRANFETEFKDKSRFAIAFTCFKNETGNLVKDLVLLYRENEHSDWIQGINCNIRNILLQSAIIPAFRDPKDQLRISSYSWFGKLLKAYLKSESTELDDAFASVKAASDEMFKDLRDKVSGKEIDIAFPNTSISFQFNPDTKQDIHKSTLIYVNDGFNSELKDKGAGIQSAVTIGLYDFYVRNVAHSGSSLLAVEEPELYLHPHGRRIIANRLTSFATGGKNQVIVTTHTPEFVSTVHETQNIISVRKEDTATTAKNIHFNSAKRKQILIKKQNAEMLFADAVLLTEGADKYFLEEAARLFGNERKFVKSNGDILSLGENWLNDHNISVINTGGKTELWKYAEVLTDLSIKYFTTADFDFLREGLSQYITHIKLPKTESDRLNALKQKITKKVSGKYKSIDQLGDNDLEKEVKSYLQSLATGNNVFIFSGELENFYKVKPTFDKEAGVIEVLGKVIEGGLPLGGFLRLEEYNSLFLQFVKHLWQYEEYVEENQNIPNSAPENLDMELVNSTTLQVGDPLQDSLF